MPNILVTGAQGQLATAIRDYSHTRKTNNLNFVFLDKNSFDITNHQQCKAYLKQNKVDYIINCAAYTAVDNAETDQETAYAVNSLGPLNLAMLSDEYNCKLIHISTDYVYSGSLTEPYSETDKTTPINYYGETKLTAEQNIAKHTNNYIIIRTGWLYYHYGHNFFNTMLKLTRDKTELNIVADQYGTPTYCGDLAEFIINIIKQDSQSSNNNFFNNIYNYSNMGSCSWYDFAVLINDYANHHCKLKPIVTEQYPTPAKRPSYSVLNKDKVKKTFALNIPSWQDGLKKCISSLTKDKHRNEII